MGVFVRVWLWGQATTFTERYIKKLQTEMQVNFPSAFAPSNSMGAKKARQMTGLILAFCGAGF